MNSIKVSEYVEGLDENPKKYISDFIGFMNAEFPEIIPKISFAMPMWLLGKKMYDGYVGISPAKEHFSIHLHDEVYLEKLKSLLPKCKYGKKCINIQYGDEEAYSIVQNMIKEYFSSQKKI